MARQAYPGHRSSPCWVVRAFWQNDGSLWARAIVDGIVESVGRAEELFLTPSRYRTLIARGITRAIIIGPDAGNKHADEVDDTPDSIEAPAFNELPFDSAILISLKELARRIIASEPVDDRDSLKELYGV